MAKQEAGIGAMPQRVLKLDAKDNVIIALETLRQGDQVRMGESQYDLVSDVPAKFKFATEDLAVGDSVIMYGVLVGKAVAPIRRGEVITVRNMRHEASPFQENTETFRWTPPDISKWRESTFLGYHRADGQVGTRNHWLVIPMVFCENRNIAMLKQAFEEELGFAAPPIYRQQVAELARLYREGKSESSESDYLEAPKPAMHRSPLFENIDGIQFMIHEGGCGGTREDSNNLCGLLAGYIHHPNVAGATVLSLGCQNSQTAILREQLRARGPAFPASL